MKTILVFITVAVFVLSSEAWFVKKSKRGSVELTIPHGGKMAGNDEPSEREKTQQMIRAGKMLGTVIGKLIGIAGASATGGVITIGKANLRLKKLQPTKIHFQIYCIEVL